MIIIALIQRTLPFFDLDFVSFSRNFNSLFYFVILDLVFKRVLPRIKEKKIRFETTFVPYLKTKYSDEIWDITQSTFDKQKQYICGLSTYSHCTFRENTSQPESH